MLLFGWLCAHFTNLIGCMISTTYRYSHYWRPWPKAIVPIITVLQIAQLATVALPMIDYCLLDFIPFYYPPARFRQLLCNSNLVCVSCTCVLVFVLHSPSFLNLYTVGNLDVDHQPEYLPCCPLCQCSCRTPLGISHPLCHGSGKLTLYHTAIVPIVIDSRNPYVIEHHSSAIVAL